MPSGNSHHKGSYMPMRSPHSAHSKNGSVITHRAAISVPPENRLHSTPGQTPANKGKSTRLLWTTTEAIRQRAREHAPTRASPSDRPPRATPALTSYPASRRPIPHSITARSNGGKRPHRSKALRAHETVDRRPPTADGGRRDGGRSAETPWTRRPRWRRRRNPALECPSPRRRKSMAHASGGRFPLFKPRDEAHRPRTAPENVHYVNQFYVNQRRKMPGNRRVLRVDALRLM